MIYTPPHSPIRKKSDSQELDSGQNYQHPSGWQLYKQAIRKSGIKEKFQPGILSALLDLPTVPIAANSVRSSDP